MSHAVGDGLASRSERPSRVLVWRSEFLSMSETFVVNQAGSLTRWQPVYAGQYRADPALPVEPRLLVERHGVLFTVKHRMFRMHRRSRRLTDLLATEKISVVHAHFGPGGVDVLPTCRRAGVPLVVTFHGFDATALPRSTDPSDRMFFVRRLPELFRDAAQLVAVSSYIAERLLTLGAPADKVLVHHIGVPIPPAAPRPPAEGRSILFVGRMVEKKGLDDLVRAVAALPEDLRDTRLDVVGDGPARAEVERLAAAERVAAVFHGVQPSTVVLDLMRRATVLGAPSRTARSGDTEGLPTVLLEAGAAALPAVSTYHSGVPDAVLHGRTGLLSAERDVPSLSRNLATLLRDPALARRMGAAARSHVEDHFDVAKQGRVLEHIYDTVSEQGRAAAVR